MKGKNPELIISCLPPDKSEVFSVLSSISDNTVSENNMVLLVMKHFKGKANPVFVRKLVSEYINK